MLTLLCFTIHSQSRNSKINCSLGKYFVALLKTRVARVTGLEPVTSAVTGQHSNQLSYTR